MKRVDLSSETDIACWFLLCQGCQGDSDERFSLLAVEWDVIGTSYIIIELLSRVTVSFWSANVFLLSFYVFT